ncbi:MAG: SurA N-terminal domain-containing protein, partial [Actinomycetes bacterium]
MKKVMLAAVLLVLLASAFAFAACGGNQVPAGAIASVGSATVTQQQFDEIWAQAKAQYASQQGAPAFPKEGTAQYDQLKASIVNYLVQNEIIKQQAADMKVTVTPKQIDDRIKQIVTQVGGQKKFDALLKKQGVSMDQLRTQLQAQMLQSAVQAKVGENVKVTEAQIKAYFDDPANKAQFVVADAVTARHVLVKTKAEALKVQKLLAANNTDANWAKVAKQYSTDPGTKAKGGDLGSFTAAAQRLSLPKSSVSARVARLEARLGARLRDRRAFGALLFTLAPLWGLAGGWALPDVPLTFGILLAANGLFDVLDADGPSQGWSGWLWAGVGAGVALLSKYHAVLILAGLAPFFLAAPAQRRRLAHPGPWAAALIALVLPSPVLLWNWQHH